MYRMGSEVHRLGLQPSSSQAAGSGQLPKPQSLNPSLFFLAVPRGMRDLSSPTEDGTQAPCSGSSKS